MSAETKSSHSLAGKYLTFALHHESYGVDVLKVREIIRMTDITAVPQMPDFVRGVLNLRGKIIPVMDLRRRFQFPAQADNNQTCIVVAQVRLPDGKATQMGLVVDGVEEVINCTNYILGIAKVKGAVKALLDIDGVVGSDLLKNLRPVLA